MNQIDTKAIVELLKFSKIRGAMLKGKSPYDVVGKVSEIVKIGDQEIFVVCEITADDIRNHTG